MSDSLHSVRGSALILAEFEDRRPRIRADLQRLRNQGYMNGSNEVIDLCASVRREDRYFSGVIGYRRCYGLNGGCCVLLEGSAPHAWLATGVIVGFKSNGEIVSSRVREVRDTPGGTVLIGEPAKRFHREAERLGICEPGLYLVVGDSFRRLENLGPDPASAST